MTLTINEEALLLMMTPTEQAIFREAREKWKATLAQQRQTCMDAQGDEYVDAVCRYLRMLSSEKRAAEVVSLLEHASPASCWKVFLTCWPDCDDTWDFKDRLLQQLRKVAGQVSGIPYYSTEQRAFLESLPDRVIIHRGCSRRRIPGISWTTDYSTAKQFAHGHRRRVVPEPVIATAEVLKKDIFAVFTDRGESEVVCAPARILTVANYDVQRRELTSDRS